ncbi:MAG: hypothetical protein ABI318_14715 [Chthoniobacteraceae bacterium]
MHTPFPRRTVLAPAIAASLSLLTAALLRAEAPSAIAAALAAKH